MTVDLNLPAGKASLEILGDVVKHASDGYRDQHARLDRVRKAIGWTRA